MTTTLRTKGKSKLLDEAKKMPIHERSKSNLAWYEKLAKNESEKMDEIRALCLEWIDETVWLRERIPSEQKLTEFIRKFGIKTCRQSVHNYLEVLRGEVTGQGGGTSQTRRSQVAKKR